MKEYTADDIQELDDKRLEESESGKIDCTRVYLKYEADKVIADLEESHKKEVGRLQRYHDSEGDEVKSLKKKIVEGFLWACALTFTMIGIAGAMMLVGLLTFAITRAIA